MELGSDRYGFQAEESEGYLANKNTKNAKGAGTIRKRPDGRWEARYSLGFDPKTGRQIQRSVYGATQKEVRQKLAKITSEIDEGSYMEPSKDTLEAWLETWLKTYVAPSVKPYTLASYRGVCENFLNPALGRVKLSQLTAPQIQQMYNEILMDRGLSAKTVKNIHGVLHRALNQAVKLGMIRFNPSEMCDLPKVIKKDIRPLEKKDIAVFLEAIRGHEYEHLYQVTLFTGLRQGEVLGLTWDCVDFEHKTLYINKQLQKDKKVGGEYALVPTKNSRSRIVTVADSVMTVLQKVKQEQARKKEIADLAWSNPWNLVFTNEFGQHLCHFTVYHRFKDIVRGIGLEEARFHDLRHSYAVVSIESGDDIKTVQSNLGHATASFTLDVYGHVSQKMRQQSADRMEQFIQGLPVPVSI